MAAITKKDIFDTLSDFYGKVIEPRFDRIEKRLDEHDQKFKDMLEYFDKIYSILGRMDAHRRKVAFYSDLPGSGNLLFKNRR